MTTVPQDSYQVRFELPEQFQASTIAVVGEFNDWRDDSYEPNEFGEGDSVNVVGSHEA